jgi:hypothetical protein
MPNATNEKVYTGEQTSFLGGVVSTVDIAAIDVAQVGLLQNAYPARSGESRKRPGFEDVGDSGTASPVRFIRRFDDKTSTFHGFVGATGANLWVLTDAGAFTVLKTDLDTARAQMANEDWLDAVYYSDGANGLWKVYIVAASVAATLVSNMTAAAADLTFTAKTAGHDGNDISIQFVDPAAASQSLTITNPTTGHFVISLATDGAGAITSVANGIKTAVDGDTTMAALVSVAVEGAGTGLANALAAAHLTGGLSVGDPATALVSASYSFAYLARRTAGSRLFGILSTDATYLRWCDSSAPGTWGVASFITTGAPWTSAIEIERAFLATQADAIYRIDGTDPTTWEVTPIGAAGLGCSVPFSLVETEGVAVYYSPRGLAYFDGSKARPLSDQVFDAMNSARSLLPSDTELLDNSFCVVSNAHIYVFFKSIATKTGCDRAMVYDFRAVAWGGPYHLGFEANCGCQRTSLVGDPGALHVGLTTGHVARTFDGWSDLGTPFDMLICLRGIDAGRATLDKVYREVRIARYMSGSGTTTVRMLFEDESAARTNCTRDYATTGEQDDLLVLGLPAGTRARMGWVEVLNSDAVDFHLAAEAVDLFFVRAR